MRFSCECIITGKLMLVVNIYNYLPTRYPLLWEMQLKVGHARLTAVGWKSSC